MAKRVTGVVTDSYGPVPGICVKIKGAITGTVTDIDGKYAIECNDSDILEFSGVGYKTKEIRVGSQSVINVTMEFDNPVVVTPQNARHNLAALAAPIGGDAFWDDKTLWCVA